MASPATQVPANLDVLKKHALPLSTVQPGKDFRDLEPFAKYLEEVQVVGMGEGTHGTREFFQMKHRMFQFLVERMGFTVFAIEASMSMCRAMDDYVMRGQQSPEFAASIQGFWTWQTEEVRDLLKWMREYNLDPRHTKKLRAVGFDMQDQGGAAGYLWGEFVKRKLTDLSNSDWTTFSNSEPSDEQIKRLDVAMAKILPTIEKEDGKEKAEFARRIHVVLGQAVKNKRQLKQYEMANKVLPKLQDTLKDIDKLQKGSDSLSSDGKYGLEYIAEFSKAPKLPSAETKPRLMAGSAAIRAFARSRDKDRARYEAAADFIDYAIILFDNSAMIGVNFRDKCMAENVAWITETYLPGQKAMLWAHNGHIACYNLNPSYISMGGYLTQTFNNKYYPIGFAFGEGSFQAYSTRWRLTKFSVKPAKAGTVEDALRSIKKPLFILPFDSFASDERAWIDGFHPMRMIGALFDPSKADIYVSNDAVGKSYRALIYVDKTTRAKPLKLD